MWKQFLHEYLSFSKKERTGIFIVLALICFCLSAPFFYSYFIHRKQYDHSQFDKEVAELKFKLADTAIGKNFYNRDGYPNGSGDNYTDNYDRSEKNYSPKIKGEVFYFDPNTATVNDWKRLGIRDKTAETIQKYISKGGHFYKPGDITKIWGLHKDDIDRLLPYVKIENGKKEFTNTDPTSENKTAYKKPPSQIDVNASDTAAFISLPGIGSKLAQRIIAFREKLGGFYSVDQVKETYGLPDSTFQKIRAKLVLAGTTTKKININTATIDEMKTHPYIRYNLANALLQYRVQHGNFSSVADIKKIMTITDDIFNKVAPYLTVN